ncbi:MAG TPA: hypothetical protein DCZ95_03570 [Verrucomicrobia bacterium]|nr:MAG: hypothetical protein A2X46_01395 [Lentisphaerae bacterium GWF2_57_35]HBA83153.1 hypothetical protein [Verrucomicrobiota bacterium]
MPEQADKESLAGGYLDTAADSFHSIRIGLAKWSRGDLAPASGAMWPRLQQSLASFSPGTCFLRQSRCTRTPSSLNFLIDILYLVASIQTMKILCRQACRSNALMSSAAILAPFLNVP